MENQPNFLILLNQENVIYKSGEEFSGKVLLRITERQKINSIYLQFKGEAYVVNNCKWTEMKMSGTGRNRTIRSFVFSDRDTIFEFKQLLLQKDPNMSELYIEPNEYNYPFKFTLPNAILPTSYQHFEANIRYWLEATIDGLRQPVGESDTKVICSGLCKNDTILIELNTNKCNLVFYTFPAGYVPGETIVFNAKIDNHSNKTIKSVSASFIQRTTFIAEMSRRHYNNKLASALYTGATIGPGTLGNWSNVPLKIPIVCPSLLDTCKIIKLEYMITLVVQIDTFIGGGSRLDIPIVIGTIPLVGSIASSSTATYCTIPKAFSIVINNGVETDANFTPKYPYYKDLLPS